MSKAEEIHYKAVMAADNQEPPKDYVISAHADHFNGFVEGFVEGYEQAEKDLEMMSFQTTPSKDLEEAEKDMELGWKDMRELYIIFAEVDTEIELCKTDIKAETIGYYQEVLKRFKDLKK